MNNLINITAFNSANFNKTSKRILNKNATQDIAFTSRAKSFSQSAKKATRVLVIVGCILSSCAKQSEKVLHKAKNSVETKLGLNKLESLKKRAHFVKDSFQLENSSRHNLIIKKISSLSHSSIVEGDSTLEINSFTKKSELSKASKKKTAANIKNKMKQVQEEVIKLNTETKKANIEKKRVLVRINGQINHLK